MNLITAIVIADGSIENVKKSVESIRREQEQAKITVLYRKPDSVLEDWCEEQSILKSSFDTDASFARQLREALTTDTEDVLLMSSSVQCLPHAIERMQEVLYREANIGAVIPEIVTQDIIAGRRYFKSLADYAEKQRHGKVRKVVDVRYQAVLWKRDFLQKCHIEDSLFYPNNILIDMVVQGIVEHGYYFYKVENALFEEVSAEQFVCSTAQAEEKDFHYLDTKWNMGYILRVPNEELLKLMQSDKTDPYVLEIGCSGGTNLMEVGNRYPDAHLYGVEINENAAKMAVRFAETQVGNIEEKNLDFGNIKFDYIMFGDVLEHLHDPKGVLEYCQTLLAEHGKIIASIPNLMHWSVMKVLINGFFPYADFGLLDRTHIHFFTYYEMVQMFEEAGYAVEQVEVSGREACAPEAQQFIDKLMNISESAEEFMFSTFQYRILAEKRQ